MRLRAAVPTAWGDDQDGVIKFKQSVDELSRLSAARSEDESMVRQLAARQLDAGEPVSADVLSRLCRECVLRDEWREERSVRALRVLPAIAADAERFDAMREYVALLAVSPAQSDRTLFLRLERPARPIAPPRHARAI